MDRSTIEWTDSTWNPATGCTKLSAGCANCYAYTLAEQKRGTAAFPHGFDLQLRPHKLTDPDHWRTPRRVFVNSMSDLFHPGIPVDYVRQVFAVMARNPRHQFQVLTKRPGRALALAPSLPWPAHIWMGVTVENQHVAARIGVLLRLPAPVRFLSCEPLLGPLDLTPYLATGGLHWVIDGGESGSGRRPGEYAWFRGIRDQCQAAGVAYLHKQGFAHRSGQDRLLDGRSHDEYPIDLAAAGILAHQDQRQGGGRLAEPAPGPVPQELASQGAFAFG